ncbi:hypothetical protein EPH95_06200 [Salicibibacter halophilus]|uniref:Uncharacterized protein n=1 Tax=Salicibibacter halophilus TaxID=2502791 RepID=A0A514LG35_9BACI|nr:hypothetical protein [Salicibibacter halophilus]QDI90817.1 hypothetical protein EPH95_06200 [Salicibibacter halophilus]
MAKTPAEKRTSQDPAALILREEAWPFVRGKRSHGSDIPPLRSSCSAASILKLQGAWGASPLAKTPWMATGQMKAGLILD